MVMKKTDDLLDKVSTYLAKTHARRRFERKHEDVFAEHAKLEKAEKAALEAAKTAAREHATPGATVVPLETADVRVMVIGGYEGVAYDPILAREHWAKEIFFRVIEVDAKKVEAMMKLDQIDPAVAKKAEKPEVPLEPRVKIEVLGK